MSVLQSDLVVYGSAVMPDDDTTLNIGGAIDKTTRVSFVAAITAGNLQVVSSSASDTTQTVTAFGRNPAGDVISEGKTLTGTTPVAMTTNTSWERIEKGTKSATAVGDVAIETVTAVRSNTAQTGAAATSSASASITLDTGASASDDAYNSKVIRLTGGTGAGQIRRGIDYVGATKVLYVNRDWDTVPDATTTFKISDGFVFEKTPNEVSTVRIPFYGASAEASGGSNKTYYEKVFFGNNHATLSLTSAVIVEQADPSANITFGLASTLDDTGTNGAGNSRLVAPGGITFDSANKNVANSQSHTAGAGQGIWLAYAADAGDAAIKTTYSLRETGTTT